jgi:hypothetical protein
LTTKEWSPCGWSIPRLPTPDPTYLEELEDCETVDWVAVDYFRELIELSPLTKHKGEKDVFDQLKARGITQKWLVPSYELFESQPYLRMMHADRVKRLTQNQFYIPTFLDRTNSPAHF